MKVGHRTSANNDFLTYVAAETRTHDLRIGERQVIASLLLRSLGHGDHTNFKIYASIISRYMEYIIMVKCTTKT